MAVKTTRVPSGEMTTAEPRPSDSAVLAGVSSVDRIDRWAWGACLSSRYFQELKIATAVLMVAAAVGLGVGGLFYRAQAGQPPAAQ